MTSDGSITPEAQQKQLDRKRKRKAILAGGVVLGLGAAATLAAWSDDVFANGTFQTGEFNLLGSQAAASTDIEDYDEYNTAETAADLSTDATPTSDGGVNFRIDSLNLSPGETVVAPFSVATSEDTTVDGRYWLQKATASGPLAPFLEFAIVQSDACIPDDPALAQSQQTPLTDPWKSGSFGATQELQTVTFGSVRSATGKGPDIALAEGFDSHSHLCIGVSLANNEQGIRQAEANGVDGRSSIVWEFAGGSLPLEYETEE